MSNILEVTTHNKSRCKLELQAKEERERCESIWTKVQK